MQKQPYTRAHVFAIIGMILTWFAVALQFYLILLYRKLSIGGTIIQFFSYFTILSNLITAVCFTACVKYPDFPDNHFFAKPKTVTAVTVYMAVVGLVYNIALRHLTQLEGANEFVNELLHVVNPLWILLFWFLFVPKNGLLWKHIFPWLIYPFVYLIYVLIRGRFTGLYPYPFVNADNLGYATVSLNCILVCVAFLFFSLLFVGIAKKMKYRQ